MKRNRACITISSVILSLIMCISTVSAEDTQDLLSQAETAKEMAEYYETGKNYSFVWNELCKYAELTETLAEAGDISEKDANIAAVWRDHYEFSPELYITDFSKDEIFFGSDGTHLAGSSAVKISVPFEMGYVSDYYSLIPASTDELCVLVSLDVTTGESTLRNIAFGNKDNYITKNLRQMSLIEGRVYLSFCPSPNTLSETRTIANSFILAYQRIATLARRYAPNVELVFTLGDIRDAGTNTFERFYPGDEYVDVFGIEVCHTYNKSDYPSPEAAFDCRGEYYDPLLSVMQMLAEAEEVVGEGGLPIIIEGSSFPWTGSASVTDWEAEMERFYSLIPAICPNLKAVFYSNASSSAGICNLHQNKTAAALYEQCAKLPGYVYYEGRDSTGGWTAASELTKITPDKQVCLELYLSGMFSGAEYKLFLDGTELTDGKASFSAGEHTLEIYVTESYCSAKIVYTVLVSENGDFSMTHVSALPEYDINGNGILDFADSELLNAYIAHWDIDLSGYDLDINGDGTVNLWDTLKLLTLMKP